VITGHRDLFIARCKERGYRWQEVEPCVVSKQGDIWTIDENHPAYPRVRPPKTDPPRGAGTALKGLLKMIGITSSPTCGCNRRAKEMDRRGIQWCRVNVDLISSWLAEEAGKRKLPYVNAAGKAAILLAIRRGARYPEALP
jgi:hypothetical protein